MIPMNIYRDLKQLPNFENTVITIGSFDGLHRGHQKILKRVTSIAKEIGVPSVVITFHPHPRKVVDQDAKVLKSLNTIEEKIDNLSNIGIDNLVIVPFSFEFSRMAPREYIENFLLKNFAPSHIVIGYDHRFGLNRAGDISLLREYCVEHSFEVVEIHKQDIEEIAISSTEIRKALGSGDIETANRFLGAPYIISGKVVHGDKFGGKMGFPTANVQIADKDKLIPAEGIYVCTAVVDGVTFKGVTYIGRRPTIGDQLASVVEVHLFDFDQNIYERIIRVSLLHFLRGDMKLESIDALKKQMSVDVKDAKTWLLDDKNKKNELDKPIKATIAILNFNGAEMLESYLPMIEYSSSRNDIEIVLIDNNSTDDSVEYIEEWHPEIKVISLSKNYGFADGYNRGLREIDSEYVVFLNSDVLVTENWLDPILDLLDSDNTIAAVQPTILSLEDKNKYEHAGAAGGFLDILGYPFCRGRIFDTVENFQEKYSNDIEVFWASGAAMVMRTNVFKGLGGFDATFFAHQEEIDLCWRAKSAGFKIMATSKSKVYHLGGATLEYGSSTKVLYNFRNNLYMLTKNESFSDLLWILPMKLILDGLAGIKFLLAGNLKATIAVVRAHIEYYVALPIVIENGTKDFNKIRKMSVGKPNMVGRYANSIVLKYYIRGCKTYDSLFK
jgi:riboflavin kinase/FMN adenylyltransferase